MSDCIFCKIISGEIPSVKIWEDDDVFVFLDIHPLTRGHCLIIPKIHYQDMFDIDQKILQKIITSAKYIAYAVKKSLGATAINLVNASGKDAEQSVFHFHLHLIPRYPDDGLHMNDRWQTNIKSYELNELNSLSSHIQQSL